MVGVLGRRDVLKQRSSGFCYIGSESAPSSIGHGIVCMELGCQCCSCRTASLACEEKVVAGRCVSGHLSDIFLHVVNTPHLPEESVGFLKVSFLLGFC